MGGHYFWFQDENRRPRGAWKHGVSLHLRAIEVVG